MNMGKLNKAVYEAAACYGSPPKVICPICDSDCKIIDYEISGIIVPRILCEGVGEHQFLYGGMTMVLLPDYSLMEDE